MTKTKKPSKPGTKRKTSAAKTIRVDPVKEYRERIGKLGAVEMLTLADSEVVAHVSERISTGSIALDRILGGGIPMGRITEIHGKEHVGKSTLAAHILASAQRMGAVTVLIDSEEGSNAEYYSSIGVDPKHVHMPQFSPLSIESSCQFLEETFDFWADHGKPVVAVWDSIAQTPSHEELYGDIGDSHPATAAKALRKIMRRLVQKTGGIRFPTANKDGSIPKSERDRVAKASKGRNALIVINHTYQDIGARGGWGSGPRNKTYGGAAVPIAASVRLQLWKGQRMQRGDVIVGNEVGVSVVKSKVGGAQKECRVGMLHGVGIDNVWNVFEDLKAARALALSGSWYSVQRPNGDTVRWQGGFLGLNEQIQQHEGLWGELVAAWEALPRS